MMDGITLFNWGEFKAHSGDELDFKIDCDALTDVDLDCFTKLIDYHVDFYEVIGIPKGGLRLAEKLKPFRDKQRISETKNLLIVDDVLTTGRSMNLMKDKRIHEYHRNIIGVVIFARGECPSWVHPIFELRM